MRQQAVNRKFGAETFFWPRPAFPIGAGVLLVGSFLYVWLRVEPVLEYHSYGPYFFRQRAFMDGFLGRPGGLASYAGVFLAQLNCLSWLGALVFVLFECGVVLAALVWLARISGRAPGFIALVPLFVLVLLRNRYGCPVAAISVGFLLALAACAAYALLPWRRPWCATAAGGVVSALLFFVAGLWSGSLFAVLCCLFVSIRMRSWPAGLVCLFLGLAAPAAVLGAGKLGIARLVNPWPEGVCWGLAAALYASVPVAGAVLALLPEPGATRPAAPRPVLPKRAGQAMVGLAFLVGWAAVWLSFDRRQKLLAEIDYDTGCGDYEAVLAAARQVRALSHPAKVRLHLALYHTGRLAEDLFSFHNMMDDPPLEGVGEDWRAQSPPLFELGLVNDAENMALEALDMEGDRPDLLRLLARINLLKGRPEAAQAFLNVLSLIPFQGERADAAWPTIDPRMPAAEGALLDRVRAGALTNEVPHDGLPVGPLLDVLLASNPTNQMAFEYVMAHYLMDLDLKRAVERLRLLNNFSYAGIPRAYEEALVLYQQVAGVQVKLKGRAVRPETAERFRQFREAARQLKEGVEAEGTLAARFGDTYWYYYFAALGRKQADGGQASAP